MKIFDLHSSIIKDYSSYIKSFLKIKDERIKSKVLKDLNSGALWPDPLIQFNPTFEMSESVKDLIDSGKVHADLDHVFKGYSLYRHQVEAIKLGVMDKSFIVTSGTGSGKSLTFLSTIFDYLFKQKTQSRGIKAILVYPMNALINSQFEEINKYNENYEKNAKTDFPITFAKYTGQERGPDRDSLHKNLPDILLTNYMMLELIMTRASEQGLRDTIFEHLQYLVYDELHTYRGRQGSDVSLLNRRIHAATKKDLICIGTSATMATGISVKDEKTEVANVAKKIFNKNFEPSQVIGEYLQNSTIGGTPEKNELQVYLNKEIDQTLEADGFASHPIARWLENRIALEVLPDGHKRRGKPLTLLEIIRELCEDSSVPKEIVESRLSAFLTWIENLNEGASRKTDRKSFLPFKLHQFIAQTGNVSVTLESLNNRYITTEVKKYIKREQDIDLFPVLFSRVSGHEFLCVSKDFATNRLKPRNPRELPNRITKAELKGNKELKRPKRTLYESDFPEGYLIFPHEDEVLWNDDMINDFPDTWKRITKKEISWDNFYEYRIPQLIYVRENGEFSSSDNGGIKGYFIPTHLLFDPTSGVIYDQRTNEFTKLMTLGNEGRSTATTVTALSTLTALRNQSVDKQFQKLLSFTDNRQDASLQAGHFNDFVSTIQLRSAIYHALKEKGNLDSKDIAKYSVSKLSLKESDYAFNPSKNPKYPDQANIEALEEYIFIRTLYDLKRGWRYNTPNLEQSALLEIDYLTLDQLSSDDEEWNEDPLFGIIPIAERKQILRQILDFFRTSYAFDHYKLSDENRGIIENKIKERLKSDSLWSLNIDEKIDTPYVLIPEGVGKTPKGVYTAGCGHLSYLGKYFKRLYAKYGVENIPKGDDLTTQITSVLDIMNGANMLSKVRVKGTANEIDGYRLRLDQVIWKEGDEKTVIPDEVRTNALRSQKPTPNEYFQDYYKLDFTMLEKEMLAGEHTGQISADLRQDREQQFIEGSLSALFCSPTMELGVDISSMNVVHMRNVPPGPANYAQRSGRAGRSGQTALVMTYCSNGSPHDRHYFTNRNDMVSGVVAPPKLDLTNQELIESHLNAYILMNLKLDGMRTSVSDILDLTQIPACPIKEDLENNIKRDLQEYGESWKVGFKETISSLTNELANTHWYSDKWIDKRFNEFYVVFDKAFDRWRKLYREALDLVDRSNRVMMDPTLKASSPERKRANWDHKLGLQQKEILLYDSSREGTTNGEFYIFRYLASEGFLPGYNFTRLPIRTFLGFKDKGEFVSRSRFVALREFGPTNLIYHAGNKYRINRMMVTDAESKMHKLKICNGTGYAFLDHEGESINNDPITNASLKGKSEVDVKTNVIEMAECFTRPIERISCEEEERTSTGYEINQYFSFPKGIHSTTKTVLKYDGEPLLNILYGPSARLLQFNRKWRRSKEGDDNGYRIGTATGFWKKEKDEENPNPNDPIRKVHVYTTDTSDVLYVEPLESLGQDENMVISMNYALKRAIELIYQIEESELGAWILGKKECPNILLYEASEGSLGVLSDLVNHPEKLKEVFAKASEICHYDPVTHLETDQGKALPKASYDDLLSYYNQRHHDNIDRRLLEEPLKLLLGADIEVQDKSNSSYQQRYEQLLEQYDKNSSTELKFINYLYNHGLRLPDHAQVNLKDYYISADFIYVDEGSGEQTVVFVDGSVHDENKVMEDDSHKRDLLVTAGIDVIVWRYDEPLDALVHSRKDIFRKVIA